MATSVATTDRRTSTKRRDVLRAATEIFLDAGYERASMDEIAVRAGVSKATVYSHFGSKEALFEAIIRDLCQSLLTPLQVPPSSRGNPEETLLSFARSYVDLLLQPSSLALHRLLVAEAPRNPELAALSYRAGGARVVGELAAYLRQEDAKGSLAVADAKLAAEQLFGMLNGHLQIRALLRVDENPTHEALDRHIRSAVATFLRGYATAPAGSGS